MDVETLISYYEEAKEKAQICLGFNDDINIEENNDNARQMVAFIIKELNDYLFVNETECFDIDICEYLRINGYNQLIKIINVLNYFK